jgi:hypothetical protein
MKTLVRGSTALALVMFVVSCSGLLKKKGEGEEAGVEDAAPVAVVDADAAAAPAPAPAPAALATNEGDVARFPDETKLADVPATLQRTYNVREAPPNGVVIAGLAKGTAVTQIAQRSTSFLITFDNAKAPGTKLMGWVHRDAFSAVIQDAGPLVCPTGEIALFGDTPFCGKLCSEDKDCPTGQACKGQASKLLANGKAGDGVTVCTIFHPHDAGAPPAPPPPVVVDAGGGKLVVVPDAGLPKVVVLVDAGPLPPAPAGDVVAPTGGKCPGGFELIKKTGKCHRACPGGPTAGQCKNAKPFCIKCDKEEKKVCAEAQDQCR